MEIAATTTKPVTLRHEHKIQVNKADEIQLSARLRHVFSSDSHADSHGKYRVSSLYFDTPSDEALKQKVAGLWGREKFRLRYYNHDLGFIRLEKKAKFGSKSSKTQTRMTLEEVKQLLEGEIDFLLETPDSLCNELYFKMRSTGLKPVSITRYEREAYRFEPGNVRVTIDRHLEISWNPLDFLTPDRQLFPVGDATVLEIKYDHFLPDVVRQLVMINQRVVGAYSKYAASRQFD